VSSGTIRPEVCFDLQIQLDKLYRAAERCREGLYDLSTGKLTPDAYRELLRHQQVAQVNWERKHRQYLISPDLEAHD